MHYNPFPPLQLHPVICLEVSLPVTLLCILMPVSLQKAQWNKWHCLIFTLRHKSVQHFHQPVLCFIFHFTLLSSSTAAADASYLKLPDNFSSKALVSGSFPDAYKLVTLFFKPQCVIPNSCTNMRLNTVMNNTWLAFFLVIQWCCTAKHFIVFQLLTLRCSFAVKTTLIETKTCPRPECTNETRPRPKQGESESRPRPSINFLWF